MVGNIENDDNEKQFKSDSLKPRIIVLAGVAGAGKTTVGRELARHLSWSFYDGNELQPQENILKMSAGIPLVEADRWPWLHRVRQLIIDLLTRGESAIVECSALKEIYRRFLSVNKSVTIIVLFLPFDAAYSRVASREGSYFKKELVQSQYDVLELPVIDFWLDAQLTVEMLVGSILNHLSYGNNTHSESKK